MTASHVAAVGDAVRLGREDRIAARVRGARPRRPDRHLPRHVLVAGEDVVFHPPDVGAVVLLLVVVAAEALVSRAGPRLQSAHDGRRVPPAGADSRRDPRSAQLGADRDVPGVVLHRDGANAVGPQPVRSHARGQRLVRRIQVVAHRRRPGEVVRRRSHRRAGGRRRVGREPQRETLGTGVDGRAARPGVARPVRRNVPGAVRVLRGAVARVLDRRPGAVGLEQDRYRQSNGYRNHGCRQDRSRFSAHRSPRPPPHRVIPAEGSQLQEACTPPSRLNVSQRVGFGARRSLFSGF